MRACARRRLASRPPATCASIHRTALARRNEQRASVVDRRPQPAQPVAYDLVTFIAERRDSIWETLCVVDYHRDVNPLDRIRVRDGSEKPLLAMHKAEAAADQGFARKLLHARASCQQLHGIV